LKELKKMLEEFKRKYGWYPKFMDEEKKQGGQGGQGGQRPQNRSGGSDRFRKWGEDRKSDSDEDRMPPPPPRDED